ncbi:hypothetical protein Ami103574_13800 [Aminipila butyrica]|uniref:Uncharacterized protein n=1 Tax=Aminipila butyrica TaxID=433296 RepID=A0A858BYW6_9FIRM|nr:hypothetical protein [Aminipila butyrica]QIB70298.1 hypothetical protein Ami103574_13800 [Aminipila butyrica]
MHQKQIIEIFKILIYKIVAVIGVYLLHIALRDLIPYFFLPMWMIIVIELLGNIALGMIFGLFLMNDIRLRSNVKQNIISITILFLLSFYKIYYYYVAVGMLPAILYDTTKYFQFVLGIYGFFCLKRYRKVFRLKKQGKAQCLE